MHRSLKIISCFVCLLTAISSFNGYAQTDAKKPKGSKRDFERRSMHKRDSVLRSFTKTDTSISNLVQRIEQYTTNFNQIKTTFSNGLDTLDESAGMPPVIRGLNKIDSLTNTHKSSTLRYLFVLRDNLDHIQEKLDDWQSNMEDVSAKLVQNQNDLQKFAKDTSLRIVPADSMIRITFFAQRKAVVALYKATDSINRANLLKVNLLQDKISIAYTKVLDESDQIDLKIKRFAIKAVAGESDYIWNVDDQYNGFSSALNSTLRMNKILFNIFIKNETVTHTASFIFFMLVLSWIFYVRRRTFKRNERPEIAFEQARYIAKKPLISVFLVSIAIIPYFYDHPPAIFLEAFFLVAIALSLTYIRKDYPVAFKFLLRLFIITFFYAVSNLFIQISNADRYAICLLSIASLLLAFPFFNKVKRAPEGQFEYSALALRVFISLEVLSLLFNITGRFSLAKIVGVTAVFNLWLLVVLYFVIHIIIQGLYLHFKTKKDDNSFLSWIDYNLVEKKFRNILVVLGAIMWTFFLLQNLNIDDWVMDYIGDILGESHNVASASFTLGGFIIFIAVIWLSSVVSKIISYFYDVSSQRATDLSVAKKKNRTSTLLIRLAVFSIGFLLAVAASGFPLEKLTIIISAFGIGIGFGLQNIVNNLVSGLILAFEKPIQIGDTIEVDNRSGTMQEIGIRSSKILTAEGSEVIIPNGDLISHHVVNWTLSNSNRRIELLIQTAYGADIDKVKTILKNMLAARTDIMTTPAASVFLNGINESAVEFRVFFWADDISKTLEIKSQVVADISRMFANEGIQIPSARKDYYLHFPEGMPLAVTPQAKSNEETPAKEKPQKAELIKLLRVEVGKTVFLFEKERPNQAAPVHAG